jgi:hypothetical protein
MFKLKNRHWWNMGKKYHRINYAVKVALGAADIRFELWHNGVKLSKDNPIKIQWHSAPAPEPQLNNFEKHWQPTQQTGMTYGQTYSPPQQSWLQPQSPMAVSNTWG